MRTLCLVLALALFGCGSDEPGDPLANTTWSAPVTGVTCEFVFQFGAVQDYKFLFGCVLNDGSTAVYLENGDYVITGNDITMVARRASCPRDLVQITLNASFTRTANTLTLAGPTGATIFQRVEPGDPTPGTVSIGCFDDQLYFTPFPLTPL